MGSRDIGKCTLVKVFFVLGFFILFCTGGISALDKNPPTKPACLQISYFSGLSIETRVREVGNAIFAEAGQCIELLPLPVKRAEQMTIDGMLDGELMRTKPWIDLHASDVVYVPTPISYASIIAVSLKRRAMKAASMADLQGHRVAISGGHRWAEEQLSKIGVVPIESNSIARFLELLRFEKVDVALLEKQAIPLLGDSADFHFAEVGRYPYYLVLRQEHAAHIPGFDRGIQKWRVSCLLLQGDDACF